MSARIESRATTVSWIPSEAVTGTTKAAFATVAHYDSPPPDEIAGSDTAAQGDTLDAWRDADRFRFANQLGAWIEVADGRIVGCGYTGGGRIGSTRMELGPKAVTFQAGQMPTLQAEPVHGDGWVRFEQTAGGRTGVPAPRRVSHPPFVQFRAPLAWSTLRLTLYADGRSEFQLTGASRFPRHWVYGPDGRLAAKAGSTDFKDWYRHAFGRHTPWGDTDTPAFVTAVETALERQLSLGIMRGDAKPRLRKLKEGKLLTEQGAPGDELYLVLDGVLAVEVDGVTVAEVGPGAVLGERAILEGGNRTSTLRTVTPCRIAVATAQQIDHDALRKLSAGHRREEEVAST
jgi:Cyclic nucleotide-binding domain